MSIDFFFFFNDTATTEIYTLSLHDALPILTTPTGTVFMSPEPIKTRAYRNSFQPSVKQKMPAERDRKSTRLNSSHANISYAVFCLKKKIILLYEPSSSALFISFHSTSPYSY